MREQSSSASHEVANDSESESHELKSVEEPFVNKFNARPLVKINAASGDRVALIRRIDIASIRYRSKLASLLV